MIDAHENYYKYRLSADPFRLSPDHRFVFSHPSYAKARTYLEFAILRGEGFITITGGAGTGKTTLINEIVAGVRDAHVQIATLNSTLLESRDLLHMVAAAFGLRYGDVSKATLLLGLEEFLTQQQGKNKRVVLIVDEAQGLSPAAVEELRLLANLQCKSRLLLQIVLVGQEQLREMVRAPGMEHLNQRIMVAAHLDPLTLPETVTYIEHRLKRVQWQGDPAITEDALRLIHRYSGGVPRRINLICSRLFLFGGLESKHELTGEDARSIIQDLQQESLLTGDIPESGAAEAAEGAQEAGALPLSLPRDTPDDVLAEEEGSAQESHASPDGTRRAAPRDEAEDILSSKQPLREALGQVFTVIDEDGDASGTEGGVASHAQAREFGRPVAAESLGTSHTRRRGARAVKAGQRRKVLALLVAAVALLLAFGLIWVDRGDPPPKGAAMTAPADRGLLESDLAAGLATEGAGVGVGEDVPVQAPGEDATSGNAGQPAAEPPADDAQVRSTQETSAPDSVPSAVAVTEAPAAGRIIRDDADIAAAPTAPQQEPAAESPKAPQPVQQAPVIVAAQPENRGAVEPPAEPAASPEAPPAEPSPTEIQAQMQRLSQAARERFADRLATTEAAPEPAVAASPASAPPAAPAPEPQVKPAPQSKPTPAPVVASVPKVALAPPVRPAPPPVPAKKNPGSEERIKAALLEGQWTSQGKPASLLPSDVTLCKDEQAAIVCWSVPRNVSTKFGEALYKVEGTLLDFSAAGDFRIEYRTLVKLVGSVAGRAAQGDSGEGDWQVSEYATRCQLTFPNRVTCHDDNGVVREYSR